MFIFFLVVLLLIPLTMIVFGLIWKTNPPQRINWIYGYRTAWSMKSQETWEFAHKFAGRLLLYTGVPLSVASVILLILHKDRDNDTLGFIVLGITVIQIVCLIVPILPTELSLKRNFDKKGKRK